jgi:hypothetical protein
MATDVDRENGVIRPGAIVGGALLLTFGGVLLLDHAGVFSVSVGQLIGPFVLITIGALMIVEKGGVVCGSRERTPDDDRPVRARRRGDGTGGLWMMGLGIWMLISQTHLWGLDFHNSWPLVVILSGVIMLVKGIR